MSQRVLGEFARSEIREELIGLKGGGARARIAVLAGLHGVSTGYLYAMTRDLRPQRKQRTDCGKRLLELREDPAVKLAMELVHTRNLSPKLAIRTVEANERETGGDGFCFPISIGHFCRVLRQCGIHRGAERRNATAYRPWQATFPGEIFQLDFSGLKTRWIDRTTRRILKLSNLEVSKNHPNTDPNRVRLWQFMLKDDFSRLQYSRFVACDAPNGMNVLDFLLECFRELGIPLTLYTDRDRVIRSRRLFRAESMLNKAYANAGGFRLLQHEPDNPQATGKVERAHQIMQEYENLIGVSYKHRTLDELNNFSQQVDLDYNWSIHRKLHYRPTELWQRGAQALRMPPPKLLDSAFKADEFNCRITQRVTIEFRNHEYQLPRERPFVNWIEKKCSVIWPPDEDYFWLIGLDGKEYEIARVLASVDPAGEFKRPQESTRQIVSKELKQSHKARRAKAKETGEDLLVPGFEVPLTDAKPALMPKKKIDRSLEEWAETGRGVVPSTVAGRPLKTSYAAKQWLMTEGLCATPIGEEDARWIDGLFTNRGTLLDTELRELMLQRTVPAQHEQIAIRSA